MESVSTIQISHPKYLVDQFINPQNYLLRAYPDLKSKHFYKIKFEFTLTEEIKGFLESHNFILFDILYQNHMDKVGINYHSLVLSKNDWKNIDIVQATDIHLAKRNDEMFDKIIKAYHQNQIEFQPTRPVKYEDSLKKRIVNPNNLFRSFIKKMNDRVYNNDLDFIFITGDIVDFTVEAESAPVDLNVFDYDKSNWKIFKEIILNIEPKSNEQVLEPEELLCPVFTIPGNHDFKPWQYDLNWAGIYKKVGLTKSEAKALKGQYPASPIKAILKTKDSLNAYLKEINPFLNYYLTVGNFVFIFLNSGSDSYKEITDYVSGSPSLTGITEMQINFIKNVKEYFNSDDYQIILSIHGPPINTPLKRGIISRFKKVFNKNIKTNIDQFKESNFKKINGINDKARIDNKFNIKYGTVSKNWDNLLKFCFKNCILTISGHTHILNEYRLIKADFNTKKSGETGSFPFIVYYDDYSEICDTSNKICKMGPFIVQTPALGFKSYKKPGKVGGFREIHIRKRKLNSFKVNYL